MILINLFCELMSSYPPNFTENSGFQSSFLQTMPYQIIETREIPLNRSSFRGRLPKVPLQPPRLVNQMLPSNNQLFSQTLLPNSIQPGIYQGQQQAQFIAANQANVIPSSPIQFTQSVLPSYPITQTVNNISSIPSINVPISTNIQASSSNNITKSVEESEVEYPPEQIQTVQEVVERKIVVRPDLENKSLMVKEVEVSPGSQFQLVNQEAQVRTIPQNIISSNVVVSNPYGQTNEEVATVREVIQKTVKVQPSPIAKVYKKEIIERRIPVNQYVTSEPKVTYSNAEIVSQEIIREIKPEIKQQVIMTQVPRQVVIPIKRQIPGSPERHIVFGQERIVISPRTIALMGQTNFGTGVITQQNTYQFAGPSQTVQFSTGGIIGSPNLVQNISPVNSIQGSPINQIPLSPSRIQNPIILPTSDRKF